MQIDFKKRNKIRSNILYLLWRFKDLRREVFFFFFFFLQINKTWKWIHMSENNHVSTSWALLPTSFYILTNHVIPGNWRSKVGFKLKWLAPFTYPVKSSPWWRWWSHDHLRYSPISNVTNLKTYAPVCQWQALLTSFNGRGVYGIMPDGVYVRLMEELKYSACFKHIIWV